MSDDQKTEVRDLEKIVSESGLSTTKARELVENFRDVFDLAERWEVAAKEIVVDDASQTHRMAAARALRLEIREKRLAVEAKRKELKEDALREGKAIDGLANILKGIMVPLEKYLDEQEHFVKLKEEREAAERARLAEEALQREEAEKAAAEEEAKRIERVKAAQDMIVGIGDLILYGKKEEPRVLLFKLEEIGTKVSEADWITDEEKKTLGALLAQSEMKVHDERERLEAEAEAERKKAEAEAEEKRKADEKAQKEKLAAERKKRKEAEAKAEAERKEREEREEKARVLYVETTETYVEELEAGMSKGVALGPTEMIAVCRHYLADFANEPRLHEEERSALTARVEKVLKAAEEQEEFERRKEQQARDRAEAGRQQREKDLADAQAKAEAIAKEAPALLDEVYYLVGAQLPRDLRYRIEKLLDIPLDKRVAD